jgi:acyl-CoA dehydrogenase
MPHALSPDEAAFDDEVRRFLDQALTPALRAAGRRTSGIFTEYPHGNDWHRILATRGWSVPKWPVQHGGTGWSPMQHHLFACALADADAPQRAPMGPGMVAPVIIAFGTPAQQAAWLPGIRNGDDYWCQGYSEPDAGSDLAALQTRAVRGCDADGEHFILNGSKIWTTHAQHANRMFCLVRTASGGKPQQGISFLCFDMALPGITVRPIHSLSGDHELNQVFFDNVRVPAFSLIGEENQGWTIAKFLLQHERGGSWTPMLRARWRRLGRALDAAFAGPQRTEPEVADLRRELAALHVRIEALQALERQALRAQTRGEAPGIGPSVGKILGTELKQALTALHVRISGPAAMERDPGGAEPDHEAGFAMSSYLNDRAASIYAGTNEVQRNLVAAQLLSGGPRPAADPDGSDTDAALADSLGRWLTDQVDLHHHARADAPARAGLWPALVRDLGLAGAGLPEHAGGLGGGLRTHAVVLRTLGGALCAEPYLSSAVVAGGVLQRCGGPVATALLAALAEGRATLAWAHDEAGHRTLPGRNGHELATTVSSDGDGWRLNGAKHRVTAGPDATHLLVSARSATQPGPALLLVPALGPGVQRHAVRGLDGGWACRWTFDDVALPADALLMAGTAAADLLDAALDEGALALCAEALGVLDRLIDDTREHLHTRRQFGAALAGFQVLQHRLADMHLARAQAEALTLAVVDSLAGGEAPAAARALAVSAAKVMAGQACRVVGEGAVQLHGAMGVTEELSMGRFFRRALQIGLAFGHEDQHLRRIERLMTTGS